MSEWMTDDLRNCAEEEDCCCVFEPDDCTFCNLYVRVNASESNARVSFKPLAVSRAMALSSARPRWLLPLENRDANVRQLTSGDVFHRGTSGPARYETWPSCVSREEDCAAVRNSPEGLPCRAGPERI